MQIELDLVGTSQLAWVPAADSTRWTLALRLAAPVLRRPVLARAARRASRRLQATWNLSALATTAPADAAKGLGLCTPISLTSDAGGAAEDGSAKSDKCLDLMAVGFIDPVNPYVLSDRAVKYDLLFIALTFIAVGLIEVLSGRRVHPVQYLLVGLALSLFFLLLLSLSEHLPFEQAYAGAAAACAVLLGVYATAHAGPQARGRAVRAGHRAAVRPAVCAAADGAERAGDRLGDAVRGARHGDAADAPDRLVRAVRAAARTGRRGACGRSGRSGPEGLSMAASVSTAPRRGMGSRTRGALFLTLVAAILGAMPGWKTWFAAWVVLSWLALACVILGAAAMAISAALHKDWPALRVEGRQVLNVAVLMLLMLPLGLLSLGVEFASAHASLLARADASARAGGPAIAMTPTADADWPLNSGFVYDRDGVLSTPPARRPAAWSANPVVIALGGECVDVRHLVGPYYRWNGGCDGL